MVNHRPCYHFQPPANWMNDPNGPIQWRGRYHLFYQHNPQAPTEGPKHWGHAVSSDLVHWEHQPIALAPGPGQYDREGVWSGCAVDDAGVPTILYTGHPSQSQCLATGSGDLVYWEKHAGNPVIARPPGGLQLTGFRDPFTWREEDGWRMIVGSGIQGAGGAALLYRSEDLRRWTYVQPLCVGEAEATGTMWECPNFLALSGRHVLIVSPYGKVLYFIGTYAGDRFVAEERGLLDLGDPYYATNCLLDDRGRRVVWAWIREARAEGAQRAAGWSGVMSLPRILSLDAGGRLRQEPVAELQVLRRRHWQFRGIALGADSAAAVPGVAGDSLEILAEFEPTDAGRFGLGLRCSPDDAEQTAILYDSAARMLLAERERSSLSPDVDRAPHGGSFDLQAGDPLRLHVFLDRSVVEAFANGQACLTTRIYPARDDSVGLRLFASGGPASVRSLDVWELAPIWPEATRTRSLPPPT